MPYKHRDPVPVEEMNRHRYDGHHSICQTLRDLYHMTEDEEIRVKLRLAMAMAKAMNEKLQYYKREEIRRAADGMPERV